MVLYIYTPLLEPIGLLDKFTSLRWRRKFFESGEFELHCEYTAENLNIFTAGNVVHRLDRVEAGIIEGIVLEQTDNGDMISVTGRFFSSILELRCITKPFNFTGTVESAMRQVVLNNCIAQRPINLLGLEAARGFPEECTFQVTGKEVSDVVQALSKSSNIGYRIRLNIPSKHWIFEAYKGIDRSVLQNERPYVLFSDESANIASPKYTLNDRLYRNFAYVAGAGEGADRTIVEVDQIIENEPRREMYVDARDLQQDELSNSEYEDKLTQRGIEKLAESVKVENLEASAINDEMYNYIDDWDLGDIVSFQKWRNTFSQRITEVEEVYESGTYTVYPTCGSPLPEQLNFGG